MKDIIIGFSILFMFPSVIYFWIQFIYLEKTKQVKFKDLDSKNGVYCFCKNKKKD